MILKTTIHTFLYNHVQQTNIGNCQTDVADVIINVCNLGLHKQMKMLKWQRFYYLIQKKISYIVTWFIFTDYSHCLVLTSRTSVNLINNTVFISKSGLFLSHIKRYRNVTDDFLSIKKCLNKIKISNHLY